MDKGSLWRIFGNTSSITSTNKAVLTRPRPRLVKTNFSLKLNGYLIPDTIQKELSAVKKLSNATQLIFNMETVSKIPDSNTSLDPRRSIQTDNNPASFVDRN